MKPWAGATAFAPARRRLLVSPYRRARPIRCSRNACAMADGRRRRPRTGRRGPSDSHRDRYHRMSEAASAPTRLAARVQRERTRRLGHGTILNRATFGLPAMPLASVAVALIL